MGSIIDLATGFCKPKKREYVKRINTGGNFCGHDPDNPLLSISCKAIRRPKVIKAAQKKLENFYSKPTLLPMLQHAINSKRQQRSERREAEIQILKVILEYTDLVTMRCGIPTETGFKPLTLRFLVQLTSLHFRRAERALSNLVKVGLLTVHQPRELVGNQWVGFAGIRTVSKKLFSLLGLGQWLKFDRTKASKRLTEKAIATGNKIIDFTKVLMNKRKKGSTRISMSKEELSRARTEMLIHLKQQYPDKSAEEINSLADTLLIKALTGQTPIA